MATASRLRGLIRPSAPAALRIQPVKHAKAPFSSSASLAAALIIKSRRDLPSKQRTPKKKTVVVSVMKPKPGERKTFRKRIQLRNNGALAVSGLGELEPGTMASADSTGRMFAVPDTVLDQLRALEAFKTTQMWGLFRRPHVLVRDETAQLVGRLEAAKERQEALKVVLTGRRLSGKSLILLQAMSHALLNELVVISIPEAQDLTNGNTEYSPIAGTEPMQFAQPMYCIKLLQSIYKANRVVLEKLPSQRDWTQSISGLRACATLADLAQGAKETEYAWATLHALWTELTLPGRPPVLFALDGLAHINKLSNYRDSSFNSVHAHDLALVRLFVDALAGKAQLPNGGAIIAATSENNTHHHPSQELALAQLEAGQAGSEVPQPDPFERGYDDRVYDSLKNTHVLRVDGASKDESRALMEYWGASGIFKDVVDYETVSQKWVLAGHGIIGEMERASLMTMRM